MVDVVVRDEIDIVPLSESLILIFFVVWLMSCSDHLDALDQAISGKFSLNDESCPRLAVNS